LVKAKYESTRPEEDCDLVLWNDLKNMFEPFVEDTIWRRKDGCKVLEWKLYDSCDVHALRMQSYQFYMLVEKIYPLTAPTLTMKLNKKLQCDHHNEMVNIKLRGEFLGLKDFKMLLQLLLLKLKYKFKLVLLMVKKEKILSS
nr:hypothetical protein [Tanacetum cinerariifolium]